MGSAKKPPTKKPGPRSVGKADEQMGGRIRAMRMDRDMSQGDLGDLLGVSFQQIQKYEKGINRISAVRLHQIATALKTTTHELSGLDGGPQVDGFDFDHESYKLAKAFSKLPHHVKSRMRNLINAIIEPDG